MWGFFQPEENYQQPVLQHENLETTVKQTNQNQIKYLKHDRHIATPNISTPLQTTTIPQHLLECSAAVPMYMAELSWFLCCAHRDSTLPEHLSEAVQIAAVLPAQHARGCT